MNRAPLSKEPVNLFILLKMAYTDAFGCQCAEQASEQTAQATVLKLELTIRFLHSKVSYLENA